eukprot:3233231-Alexandrium_andersonii.AAC.1
MAARCACQHGSLTSGVSGLISCELVQGHPATRGDEGVVAVAMVSEWWTGSTWVKDVRHDQR